MRSEHPEGVPRTPLHAADEVEVFSGNEGGTFEEKGGFASLPARLDRYGQARHRAEAILEHLESVRNGPPSKDRAAAVGARLRSCGDYLLFRHYHTIDEVKLHAAHLCQQHLVCPLCAIRRSAKQVSVYLEKYEALMAERPSLRPVFITYTVKNGHDLDERMKHLRAGLKKLTQARRQALTRAKAGQCTWRHLAGAVGALEATYNPRTGWHPHLHMVGLCDGWMSQEEMSREWFRITGDSFVVGIQKLDPTKSQADAFIETFKYAVKFGDLSPEKVWEAAEILRGQRLMFSLGCFRGVEIPASLTDEPLDDLPFIELLYRYLGGGHYGLKT